MSATIVSIRLLAVTCCHAGCGVTFGLSQHHEESLRRSHNWFYCPNGHRQHFPQKSDIERAREETAQAQAEAKWYKEDAARARVAADHAEHRRRAAKGQLTRVKNRVSAGVCPCCNRTFTNLARHMAGQHPEYAGVEA